MRLFSTLFFTAILTILTAQQIDLSGRVSIHNSRYRTGQVEYVTDAFISAPFAGETSTDSEGRFTLTFQSMESGTVIKLTAEKAGLEVVNNRDLERVILGQKSSLPIFLAPSGQLARAQTELYNISKEALYARRDALIARLKGEQAESQAALAELSDDLGREIKSTGEAMELLTDQVEKLQQQLPEFAQQLAAKNLDFASDRYVQAYEKFKAGKIRAALSLLNDEALKRSYEQAIVSQQESRRLIASGSELQQRADLQIQQVLESYRLKAQAHLTLFEYEPATATHQTIVNILEARDGAEASLELAYAYDQLASALTDLGRFVPALEYQRKAVQVLQFHYPNGHIDLSQTQTTLANAFLSLGQLDSALFHQQIALTAQEANLPAGHFDLLRSYNNLSLILQNQGALDRALTVIRYAITEMEKEQAQNLVPLATMYANLGTAYEGLGQYHEALAAQTKGIELLLASGANTDHPYLGQYYTNLATIYQCLGDYQSARETQEKAIEIQARRLESLHPALILSQNNLSLIYRHLGHFQEALSLQLEVVAAARKTLNPENPILASCLNNLAIIQNILGHQEEALSLVKEAIGLQEVVLGKDHSQTVAFSNNLAHILGEMGAYPEALKIHRKVLSIMRASLPPGHPELATTHHNLASTFIELEQLDSALHHQLISNEISLNSHGPNHPQLAINYGQLARIYTHLQDFTAAMRWQRTALAIAQQSLGPNHPDLSKAYHRLTTVYYNQGKLDSAIISETQAFTLLQNAFPEGDHPSFGVIGQTLAFLYFERGQYHYAQERLEQAAADLEKARDLGVSAPEISCYLARAYYHAAKFQLADKNLEDCYQQKLIDQLAYLNNRSMVFSRTGQLNEAKVLLNEALDNGGATSPDYHRAAGLYYALSGETETAINSLQTALQLGFDAPEWFTTEPGLDGLRELPRFIDLLEQLRE